MFVELKTMWHGFPAGHRLRVDVIGGGVADLLCRMNYAEVVQDVERDEPNEARAGDGTEHSRGDASGKRSGDDRGSQATAKYRGKR
jgi:hypothetical protein